MFLDGVNASFNDVKGRVLGRHPLPSIREVFFKLRQEEGQKRMTLGLSSCDAPIPGVPLTTVNLWKSCVSHTMRPIHE